MLFKSESTRLANVFSTCGDELVQPLLRLHISKDCLSLVMLNWACCDQLPDPD